ncbi:MAG: hypothetical protein E7109_02220 [Bacteroidales bacterium]|nr:hypothetical protein [Bacteroidales bacterium]
MNGLTLDDIATHGAGKVDVVLKIVNPYDPTGVTLDKKVSEAYVRLHMYVWPAPYAVESVNPAWNDNTSHGWGYNVFPFCFTGGKRVYGLDGRDFFSKGILIPTTETYTSTSTTFLKSSSASVGAISRTIGSGSYVGSAIFQFYNNAAFSDSDTKAEKMAKLLGYMSDNQTSEPFKLRNRDDQTRSELRYSEGSPGSWTSHYEDVTYDGLNDILGSATYYREDDYTLYYDPTGDTHTYTYDKGSHQATTDKLFVIHIGGNNLSLRYGHYFDPYWF